MTFILQEYCLLGNFFQARLRGGGLKGTGKGLSYNLLHRGHLTFVAQNLV